MRNDVKRHLKQFQSIIGEVFGPDVLCQLIDMHFSLPKDELFDHEIFCLRNQHMLFRQIAIRVQVAFAGTDITKAGAPRGAMFPRRLGSARFS